MGAMGVVPEDGVVSPAYNVYELGARLDPSYVDALVRLPVSAMRISRVQRRDRMLLLSASPIAWLTLLGRRGSAWAMTGG